VLACISFIIFELSVFIVLTFKARPERWTFKSFCLWLVSLVSWCCFPPLYVWIERKWRQASLRRALFVLLSPVSFLFLVDACTFDPHRFIQNWPTNIIGYMLQFAGLINRDWTGIDTLLSLISLVYLVYICSLVCKCVNKPFYNRRDLSSKVGIGAAYKIVNSHGRNGDMDEVDIRFDSGSETESSNKG
jgi:hypothetical protein